MRRDGVRFGVSIVPAAKPGSDPVAIARHAEELGFDLVSVWDHLHGDVPSYETWTLLTWLAAATRRITVATNVLGLPYRAPAVTAKMAESLDRLSGGRLILGLGAGGSNDEFRSFGVPERSPKGKIDALEEALHIIRGLWTEPAFTHDGHHYRVEAAQMEPKPERDIPIWIGGYGPRSLRLTGRLADGWIPSMPHAPPEVAVEKWRQVRRAADAAGRDPDAITFAYNVSVRIGEGSAPNAVSGTAEEVVRRLGDLLDMGVDVINFWLPNREGLRERLASEVLPALRES